MKIEEALERIVDAVERDDPFLASAIAKIMLAQLDGKTLWEIGQECSQS